MATPLLMCLSMKLYSHQVQMAPKLKTLAHSLSGSSQRNTVTPCSKPTRFPGAACLNQNPLIVS